MGILKRKKAKAAKKVVEQETVNVDKLVDEHKTTGTDFQAYMRERIKNKGK